MCVSVLSFLFNLPNSTYSFGLTFSCQALKFPITNSVNIRKTCSIVQFVHIVRILCVVECNFEVLVSIFEREKFNIVFCRCVSLFFLLLFRYFTYLSMFLDFFVYNKLAEKITTKCRKRFFFNMNSS